MYAAHLCTSCVYRVISDTAAFGSKNRLAGSDRDNIGEALEGMEMLKSDAEKLKNRVRQFFKKGHKSNNKNYDLSSTCKDAAKAKRRNSEADKSDKHRPSGASSDYELATQLVKMQICHRSGNCGEMAALSAYYALKTEFIDRDLIHIGELNDPGDHAFCLIAPVRINDSNLSFSTVKEFTKSSAAKSWLVIDPWLNVACTADDYLTAGGAKLDKWAADGKRVAWHAGAQGNGWYVPNGEYKDAFAKAPLELEPF